ncbi:MalY/PatB family protein [Oleiharenicola sp. Vm1]|uniref:MalY/PatB family protein n=1 Tax=Oleiharenicola sp. Vm1 TaxID=3398393 RepID=UPI0039F4FEB5
MSFDFDTPIDRARSDSQKWQKYAGQDILPLWVADMDFAAPPAVLDALQARVAHGVLGYAKPLASLAEATVGYCARRYGWSVDPSWLVWLPGLVTGLNVAARALGEDGDEILCATPVYPPFMSSPANQRRRTVAVPMVRNGARWEMDFAALERAVTPRSRAFFLCSPHNPVGRAFTRAELAQLAAFCVRHHLTLVSDEIHCDLILDDVAHLPTATLSPEIAARSITLMAPSKTYNVPGLGTSLAIIPDAGLRAAFTRAASGIVPDANVLGLVACEAAFRHGEPWRQALLAYLRGNRDLIEQTVASGKLPGVTLTHVEATYLAWLDISALKLERAHAFFERHGLGFSDGAPFGAAPNTHVRLNFGCTRATLTEALARLQRAVAAAH